MSTAGDTGSISRRRPSRVRRWMRASSRRSHHSTCSLAIASGVNRPRSTPPSASTAASAASTSPGVTSSAVASAAVVVGPTSPSRAAHELDQRAVPVGPRRGPPRRGLDQVGLEASLRPDGGGQGPPLGRHPEDVVAVGEPGRTTGRDQLVRDSRSTRCRASRSGSVAQVEQQIVQLVGVADDRAAPRPPPRRSRRGRAAPTSSATAAGRPRRSVTARARRSSSGASSRKA